jgi:hypothetical protein
MRKKEISETVENLSEKYYDLVWVARTSPENFKIKGVKDRVESIKKKYPMEIEQLLSSENPEWEHGFNSGMLAGMRYVMELFHGDKETADLEFPFLDT